MPIDIPLDTLEVLIFDCQATGSRPEKADLLEVGWSRTSAIRASADDPFPVISGPVQLPPGKKIPTPVSRITGMTESDLINGWAIDTVWDRLNKAVQSIRTDNQSKLCPTVIHFARFELPFLRHLHKAYGATSDFSLDVLCTHEVAKRLLPELPRKSLRALAGYFGHSVPPSRRSVDHVRATAFIWRHLVDLLYQTQGIDRLVEMKAWLAKTAGLPSARRQYPMAKDTRKDVPDSPGVYHFIRPNGDLLYIGKATRLRQRINSHFRKSGRRSEKSLEMLTQATKLEIKPTPSALEAALLESEEIKQFRPPYNIALLPDNRHVWFMSNDFSSFSGKSDQQHPLGPVLHRGSFSSLHAIGAFLMRTTKSGATLASEDAATLLDLPERFCPDQAFLQDGMQLFKDLHWPNIEFKPLWRSLLSIGDRQKRLTSVDSESESPQENRDNISEDITPNVGDFEWAADDVLTRLESVLGHCAWMLRRARWLIMLTESSLVWSSRQESIMGLTISSGQIVDRYESDAFEAPPLPPNYRRDVCVRKECIDLWAYDRLRVLMTELRRLTTAGRTVCLRLGKRGLLRETCLAEALRHV
jgi:DNA polymerase-3 subunit epsilon